MQINLDRMFKKALLFATVLSVFASCKDNSTEVTGPPAPVNPPVNVEDIEVPFQSNVVTPEFWESFSTDMKVVYFYSKIDSLQIHLPLEKEMTKSFCESNGIAYHEYYTNDNMGMVQLSDTLFFNLTENLIGSKEGFLFLKPGSIQNHGFTTLNPDKMGELLQSFFKN